MVNNQKRNSLSRRSLLKMTSLAIGSTVIAACTPPPPPRAASEPKAPEILTNKIADIILRQIGPGVHIGIGEAGIKEIAAQVKADLGFSVQMTVLDTDANNQRAITQPSSYHILDTEHYSLPLLISAGALQGLDISRITDFDKIVPIFTTGKLTEDAVVGQGTAPHKVMFLPNREATSFASTATHWATLIPTIYNADTLGYRPDLVEKEPTSWMDLFDPVYRGQTALVDIPEVGIIDAALAVEAAGLMEFGDKGNMTRAELEQITAILKEQKALGQFHSFWKTVDESVDIMLSGEVVLQSMWVRGVIAVKAQGVPCIYQPLKEGYRAWSYGIGISASVEGMELDAAYEYMNWWTSGFAGGLVGRQGYYSAVPENAKPFMSQAEWDFWYEGKPATEPMIDPFGNEFVPAGAVRDGGSFWERMGNVAAWNSIMDEHEYVVQKWDEFITS